MNSLNLDKYLNVANEEKIKRKLDTYIPLYPMFRVYNNKLYVVVMLTEENDNVWDIDGNVKAEYWILIDPITFEIVEFNKTEVKDFVIGDIIPKDTDKKQKELSEYTVKKILQYKNYFINDIKNEQLPIQKKLSSIFKDEFEVNGEKIDFNDYLISNLEEDIKVKINELVDVIVYSKYGSITFYYDQLFNTIIKEYQDDNIIDKDKIKLCIELINYYYDGVICIDNMFNL